jgi:metal-responsive CopG/Arc/MetJ family transcriptional regulator
MMDLQAMSILEEDTRQPITVLLPARMVAAIDSVAQEAQLSRDAVIREYIADSLPEGWHIGKEDEKRHV